MDLPPESPGAKDPTPQTTDPARAAALFEQSVAIMARLRAPGGCPWDREQSFDSIRKYTLEEAYEVFDAIERRDFAHLSEELGDLLLQVLFYAEMAANEGHFTIADVLEPPEPQAGAPASPCLWRRGVARGRKQARMWTPKSRVRLRPFCATGSRSKPPKNSAAPRPVKIRQANRAGNQPASRLDSVLRAMPALAEAAKLGAKAQKSGFDWPSWRDLLPKLAEETAELEAEAASGDPARKPAIEAELGDLLFTVGQPGPPSGRGCGDGVAQLQSALPPALQ